MNEEMNPQAQATAEASPTGWKEKLKLYKIHLAVAAAVLIVGGSALAHYKNEKVKEELVKAIGEYQDNLRLMGAEMEYDSVECGGWFSTGCDIADIRVSMMGQEQLSIRKLHIGDVEELEELRAFSKGDSVDASIDIEIESIALPKPMLAQMVMSNVSNAFQRSTLEKLSTIDLAFEAEIEGSSALIKRLSIDRLGLDNAIMPIEFAMEARDIVQGKPDAMVLESFSLNLRDRAISDVTYESVQAFVALLNPDEQALFLNEFGLTPAGMKDKSKASAAINTAIAKRFEADLAMTPGVVEKELIKAMIAMLKGESDTIVLEGENKKGYTILQLQQFLLQSSSMKENEAKKFMDDKFTIDVEND